MRKFVSTKVHGLGRRLFEEDSVPSIDLIKVESLLATPEQCGEAGRFLILVICHTAEPDSADVCI